MLSCALPVQHSPRRKPVALLEDVKKITDLEEKGIITKAMQPSAWISSMLVVAKPQKNEICLESKNLNQVFVRPKFQMPTAEELLPRLSKGRIFSTFDAKDGFYQIGLYWPLGRYRSLRMPFGISLASQVFESRLQECLECQRRHPGSWSWRNRLRSTRKS